MASADYGSAIHRHAKILISIPLLAIPLALATGLLVSYSPSPVPTWLAGFPLPWKIMTSVPCSRLLTTDPSSLATTPRIISPCAASFESSINWPFFVADVLVYTTIGYTLVPIFGKPKTAVSLLTVLAGILAMIVTSIPVSHEEIGTGYPIVYDKLGFPFPWLTFVTGDIVCGPGFNCPTGPRPVFNWVFLVFNTILYVAIVSAALIIIRARPLSSRLLS